MKTKITMVLTVIALAIGFATPGLTASDTESTDFNVTVRSTMSVNVAPDTMVYSQSPGSFNSTTKAGYDGVEIENTGSQNITNIYLSASTPTSDPYGSGSSNAYNAGNFIQAKPTTEIAGTTDQPNQGQFAFVSRRDYNESNTLSYITEPALASNNRYGRIRVANESFFWVITNPGDGSTTNGCDGSGTSTFYIGEKALSETQVGTVDFTGSNSANFWNFSVDTISSSSYGKVDKVPLHTYEAGRAQVNHTVFTFCGTGSTADSNKTWTQTHRWDIEEPENDGNLIKVQDSIERILNGTGTTDYQLQPGEHFTTKTRVSIPFGVAEGEVSQGTLTVKVNNNG